MKDPFPKSVSLTSEPVGISINSIFVEQNAFLGGECENFWLPVLFCRKMSSSFGLSRCPLSLQSSPLL